MSGGRYPAPAGAGAAGGLPLVLVEACTSEALVGQADWTINMQLVDLLVHMPHECPLVFESLKKKLRGKSHSQGLLAVVLLEALVKNVPVCHELVGTRDFLESTFVKSLPRAIRKPNEGVSFNSIVNEAGDNKSPMAIARWEATLKCIQSWSQAFDPQTYPIFHEVHRMLERRGVRFPQVEKEENAPVFLPPRADAAGGGAISSSSVAPSAPQLPSAPRSGASLTAANEIRASEETVKIFTEMLNNSEIGYPLAEDELIQQLYTTCRSNAGILTGRLTHAANAGDVDEGLMMQLLATHEKVLDVMRYYEGLVSGTMKPRGATSAVEAGTSVGARRQQRVDDGESKEESKEEEHRRRGLVARTVQPPMEVMGRSSVPPPSTVVQQPAAVAVAGRPRRKSDLPVELTQFDMLGLSPEAVSPPVVAQAPKPQDHAADPFDMSSTPFPPAANPMTAHLSVQANEPSSSSSSVIASPAPSSKRSSGGTPGGVALLAPPPSTSTRHRKDGAAAKRTNVETPATPAAVGVTQTQSSPMGTPTKSDSMPRASQQTNLFNLDLLMAANQSQPQSSPAQSTPQQQQRSYDPFAPSTVGHSNSSAFFASNPSSAFPFAAAAGFPPTTASTTHTPAAAAPQTPFDADVPASAADNPFASFDQGDPFASIAERGSKPKTNAKPFDF